MCRRVSFLQHLCQHLLALVFLVTVIPTGMRWYLIVVLVCISLMIGEAEHLFLYLLAICMSFLEKCLFKSFAHFFNWIVWIFGLFVFIFYFFTFCYWVVGVPYILDINPLSDIGFTNIFSYSLGCLFILLMVSFSMQKLFSLMFAFVACTFDVTSKEALPRPGSRNFFPMFSSSSFTVLDLTFTFLIHFELIFVTVWERGLIAFFV